MPAFIDRQLLKDRLLLGSLPLPKLDSDLDRLIATGSGMIVDRCVPIPDPPPPAVEQVTLMLAMRMRINETGGYVDANGQAHQLPLWTQDIKDILGSLILSDDPEAPLATAQAGDLAIPPANTTAAAIIVRPWAPWGWGIE